MPNQKVAIVADTAIDVPDSFVSKYHIFQIPITIIFEDGEYRDRVDISVPEVYEKLHHEIPKTSLPSGDSIQSVFDQIANEGYTHAIFFTMSSGMSGTYNLVRLMAQDEERFVSHVFDTKSIGLGGGFFAMEAAKALESGKTYEYIVKNICQNVLRSKMFGKFSSFDYLEKGGRIGLVTAKLGTMLNIKPLISVNEEGVIYTAAKVKGEKRARKEMLKLLEEYLEGHENYLISILDGDNPEDADYFEEILKAQYGEHRIVREHIGTALGAHTGPGLIIIGAYILEDDWK